VRGDDGRTVNTSIVATAVHPAQSPVQSAFCSYFFFFLYVLLSLPVLLLSWLSAARRESDTYISCDSDSNRRLEQDGGSPSFPLLPLFPSRRMLLLIVIIPVFQSCGRTYY